MASDEQELHNLIITLNNVRESVLIDDESDEMLFKVLLNLKTKLILTTVAARMNQKMNSKLMSLMESPK